MLEELNEANKYIIGKRNESDLFLKEMEIYAEENNVPIVSKEVADFLKFLSESNKAKNILEIGTAIGYSGTILGRTAEKNGGTLTTIEIEPITFDIAANNFSKVGLKNVKQILGDAKEVLPHLNEKYDFIFIDAAKGQYQDFFNESYRLLTDDGIIVIDNILFRGYVYKEETPKRYNTMVRKLDEFISELYKKYSFVLLPFGDGIGLVKKEGKNEIR